MNLASLISDNITEILVKIIKFTKTRRKVLIKNITNAHNPGFIPKDLDVNEFSNSLNNAIDEHIRNQRLVLQDTENIKFGDNGNFEVRPVVDEKSKVLLEENQDEYFELQINKLWENSLNQKVATELLKQKQQTIPTDY